MPVDHGRLFHENRFFFYLGSQSLCKGTGTMVFRVDDTDRCFDTKINSFVGVKLGSVSENFTSKYPMV